MTIVTRWYKRAAVSLALFSLIALFSVFTLTLAAQDSKDSASAVNDNNAVPSDAPVASGKTRVFPPPLTGRERWDRYVHDTFTSGPIYYASFGAALGGQASNSPKEWGRNWGGYGKRAGTVYATFAIQNSIYQAGSAALHNEGRYVPCQCNGGWHRAGYAIEMTFLTYHNGHKVLDVPQFLGAYGSGMIPVLWYPQGYSPTVQGVQNGHVQMGFVGGIRLVQEFAPELKQFFGKFKP